MDTYTLAAVILTIAIFIAYINHRFIRIASTIAIMIGSLLIAFVILILQHTGAKDVATHFTAMVLRTDFHKLLLDGMLSFFLFAGAMHIDLATLRNVKTEVITLSACSTTAATLLVGYACYYLLPLIGLHLPLLYCLLFGALISPTDPIAVLATFKAINAPKRLDTLVAGESLFNDGIAIVLFITLYQLTFAHTPITASNIFSLLGQQALGGLVYGLLLGYLMMWLLKPCHDANIVVLVSIAFVMGGYALALAMHISGPLAMVVAGIIVGNRIHKTFSAVICRILSTFWEIIDELLNAILFLLIGFEMLTIHASSDQLIAILAAIPIVLLIRLITVATPIGFINLWRRQLPYTIRMLTWGGLRGGLAVALALSLPHDAYRQFILAMTYGVVAFAIIVQGLSIKPMAHRAKAAADSQ